VSDELAVVLATDADVCGRRYTALRETKMAAVLCEPAAHDDIVGTRHLVTAGSQVARAIVTGIRRGVEEPGDLDS
jgi:hypothetical protein